MSARTRPALWRRSLRIVPAAVAALLCVVLAGCVGGSATAPAHFIIDQPRSGISDPVAISMVGLQPGVSVEVTATTQTTTGPWSSRAIYSVPPSGIVDLRSAKPLIAPYPSADQAGLLWTMQGPPLSQAQLEEVWADGDRDIRLVATQAGRQVAATIVYRTGFGYQVSRQLVFAGDLIRGSNNAAPGGTTFDVRIGTFYDPDPRLESRRPAVLLIDGDDGGGSAAFVAAQLASSGFPTFVVTAYGPEGQIPGSAALSVEDLDNGRTWLQRQHDVDPERIFTYGTWRASQLALWYAAERSWTIYGALAASGTTALLCTSSSGSAVLTQGGEPVPCEDPQRTVADTAQIRLDDIPGPLLLACGESDDVLANACDWLRAGRNVRGERPGDVFLIAPGAAHSISTPPVLPIGLAELSPAGAQATEDARVQFWHDAIGILSESTRR